MSEQLYKEELEKIKKLGHELQGKYRFRRANIENLQEFAKEAEARYAQLGFVANVDITPALVGIGPPDVAIVGRVIEIEIDHDRVRKETKQKFEADGRLRGGKLRRD